MKETVYALPRAPPVEAIHCIRLLKANPTVADVS